MTPRLLRNVQTGALYALLLLLPFSKASVEILFGVLLIGWGLERLLPQTRRDTVWLSPPLRLLLLAIGAYLAVCAFSILVSDAPALSLSGFINKWLEYLLFCVILTDLGSRPGIAKRGASLLACSSLVVILYALAQELFVSRRYSPHPASSYGRMTGPYENPIDLATYFIVVIPILFAVFLRQRGLGRWRTGGLLALLTVALARTESLGAWLGLWCGLLVMMYMEGSLRRVASFLLISSMVAGGLFLHSTGHAGKLLSVSAIGKADRIVMWQAAMHMVRDRPVLGHGLNTFMSNYLRYWVGGERQPRYAHNCYLQVAAETGLVGLAAFLILLWTLFARLAEGRRRVPPDERHLLLGFCGGLVAFAVHAAVDTGFYSLRQAALFWSLAGLAVGLAHHRRPVADE